MVGNPVHFLGRRREQTLQVASRDLREEAQQAGRKCQARLVRHEPRLRSPHYRVMTRHTNTGRKRTHLQASFDPNDHEIFTTAASTSALASSDPLQTQQEVRADILPEPSRKRPRKRQVGSEEKVVVDSSTAAVEDDGNDKPAVKSEKKKRALERLKAKEKAKRAKSTLSYF